jgi:phage terminase large subunit
MYLVREHYMTHKTIDWWAEKAVEAHQEFKASPFTCDSNNDAGQNGIAMFNDRVGDVDRGGTSRFAVPHERRSYKVGFDAVRERLLPAKDGLPTLFFLKTALAHPPDKEWLETRPDRTAAEIPGYSYRPVQDDKEDREEPVKVNDHGCDALRYACLWAWNRDYTQHAPAHEFEANTWGKRLKLRERGIA